LIQTTFEENFPLNCTSVPNTEQSQHHLSSFWDGNDPRETLQDPTEGVPTRSGSSRADVPIPSPSARSIATTAPAGPSTANPQMERAEPEPLLLCEVKR